MLRRIFGIGLCGVAITTFGLLTVRAADTKSAIKDGIQGKIASVDLEKGSVTIAEEEGRERTFSVTDETVIVGPRGGIVHKRLKDPRFHKGLSLTIVAHGSTAAQIHLGFDRKMRAAAGQPTSKSGGEAAGDKGTPTRGTRTSRFRGPLDTKTTTTETAKKDEPADEDNEFPGKVKSVDPVKRMLVITLLTGKERSFLLPSDIRVMVNGRLSRRGLSDKAIKEGIPLTVVTDAGGRKVKEVKVSASASRRFKKAG